MAATLGDLIQEIRNVLNDTVSGKYIWTDDQITVWINQGIRVLSQYLPRQIVYTISTTLNDREYDLEVVHLAVVSVEYPTGSTPPKYLKQRSYKHPNFWIEDGYYDFINRSDADSMNPPTLYISQKPAALETITLKLLSEHNLLSDTSDTTTLQDRHLNLIVLYAVWMAWVERSAFYAAYPTIFTGGDLSVSSNANKISAEKEFRTALDSALNVETSSLISRWNMDRFDHVY